MQFVDKKVRRRVTAYIAASAACLLTASCITLLLHGHGRYYFGALDSDLVNQFYPWRVFVKRWFDQGVFPLWDPHVFDGVPVLEMQQTLSLNPIRLLSTWLFSARFSLLVEAAAYTSVAAGAAWFACRRVLRCSAPAALLGTATWVMGGLYSIRVGAGHFTVLAGICWWPAATALAFELGRKIQAAPINLNLRSMNAAALKNRHTVVSLLLLAATNSMVLLAGGPQYVVYLFWIELLVLLTAARARLLGLAALAGSWTAALCLSAPQWLPAIWYLPFSGRAEAPNFMERPPLHDLLVILLELLLPHPLGDDLSQPHLYLKAAWETCTYPGVVALVLAATSVICIVARELLVFAKTASQPAKTQSIIRGFATVRSAACVVIIGLGIYLVLGGWLPGFSGFREPIKARAIVAIGISFASAVQLDEMQRFRKFGAAIVSLLLVLILAAISFMLFRVAAQPGWFESLLRSFPAPLDPAALDLYHSVLLKPELGTHHFRIAALTTLCLSCIVAVVLASYYARLLPARCVTLGLAIFACVDLFLAHWIAYYSRHPYEKIELQQDIREYFQAARSADAPGAPPWRLTLPSQVVNRSHYINGLYETGGYDPLMPARGNSRNVIEFSTTQSIDQQMSIVHRALGRRVDCSESFSNLHDAESTCVCNIVNMNASLLDVERRVTVGRAARSEAFGPRFDNLNYVGEGTSDWNTEVPATVPGEDEKRIAGIHASSEAPDGHGLVTQETLTFEPQATPHETKLSVTLQSPALLIYRTTWLPGWKVKLDDTPWRTPLCANRWTLCIPAGAGHHHVTFRYTPVALWPSLWLCGMAWAGLSIALFRARKLLRPI